MNANPSIPHNFQELFGPDKVQEAVRRVGKEIDAWASEVWNASHTDILAIPVLRGSGIFYVVSF